MGQNEKNAREYLNPISDNLAVLKEQMVVLCHVLGERRAFQNRHATICCRTSRILSFLDTCTQWIHCPVKWTLIYVDAPKWSHNMSRVRKGGNTVGLHFLTSLDVYRNLGCASHSVSCLPSSLLWSSVELGPLQTLWRTPKETHSKKTGSLIFPEKSWG